LVQNPLSFEKKPHLPAYAIQFSAEKLPLNIYKGATGEQMLMEILDFFASQSRPPLYRHF
jgi:hypothetical protein